MVWNLETDRIDWNVIRQLENLHQALPELVEIFRADFPRRLNSLEEARNARNSPSSLASVHEITSASAYLGGLGIRRNGLQVFALIEKGNWREAESAAKDL